MHELPIIKSIYKSVITKAEGAGAKKVKRVVIEVGILRDFIPELVQKYWDFISPGSIAEGSVIELRELDASAACGRCGKEYAITKENIGNPQCPVCGYRRGRLISGSELRLVGIEIEKQEKK